MRSTTTERPTTTRRIVGLGSLALALLFSVLGWHALQEREALWQLQIAKQGELQKLALQSAQTAQQQQAQILAQTIAADSWVTELVRQAHSLRQGEFNQRYLDSIRSQLKTRLTPRWRGMQQYQQFQLLIFLAPQGEMFLQIPAQSGGDQITHKQMLSDALTSQRSVAGLNLSEHQFAISAITPLHVPNLKVETTVGAVEVQLGLQANIKQLDQELDAGVALLGNLPGTSGSPEAQWKIISHSRDQVLNWQQRAALPKPSADNTLKLLEDDGRTYLLNQVPLSGYSTSALAPAPINAYALVWRDISDLYALHISDNQWLVGKWIFAWLGAEALLLLLLLATRNSTRSMMLSHQHALQQKHQQSEYSRELLTIITEAQSAYIDTQNQQTAFAALLQRIIGLTRSQAGMIGEVLKTDDGSTTLRTLARHDSRLGETENCYWLKDDEHPQQRTLEQLLEPAISGGQFRINQSEQLLSDKPQTISSLLSLPIQHQGEIIGLLGLVNRAGGYSNELIEQLQPLLSTLAQLLAALQRDIQREHANLRMQRQQQALHALNEIAALSGNGTQHQLRKALQLGASFYRMPLAIISQIEDQTYTIKVQVSPNNELYDGQHFALGETYCSLTLQQDSVLAIEAMQVSAYATHPCYELFALESYIGSTIWVNGQRYGTLNFSCSEPHPTSFDESDREFMRLFARWVGSTLERQQQEQAKQTLLARLDEAQQLAKLGHWEADLETRELFWSGMIYQILGIAPGQYKPSMDDALVHVHPEDRVRVDKSNERARAGEPVAISYRIICANQQVRWVHCTTKLQANQQGEMLKLTGTVQDITERMETEAISKVQSQRLANVIEGTQLGTWQWNVQTGETVINERWASILGYSLDELEPVTIDTWLNLNHPDDCRHAQALLEQHFSGQTAYYSVQCRMLHKAGHWVWVQSSGRLESSTADGQPLMMYGTHTDISEQKIREQETQQARRYLQTVLDSAIGVSVIATDAKGLITLFNTGAERLLGYQADDVIGVHTPLLFHLKSEIDQRARELNAESGIVVEGFEVLTHLPRAGESETRQWTYQHKSGQALIINLTVSAITDGAGNVTGFLGVGSDISALHFTTHALQKSEQRFRSMVANLPGVIYRCDNDAQWTMRYIGGEIETISGYPASDLIDNHKRSFSSLIHPDDMETTRNAVESIAQHKAFELTYRLVHADGHAVSVREKGRGEYDSEGNLLWINGFIWDISTRKAVEDELQVSQQRFSSAFSTAPQGMALVSISGELIEVNDELCRILKYDRETLLTTSVAQITHPQDRTSDTQNIRDLLAGRSNAYQIEKRYLDSQGKTLWILLSVSLVRNSQGQALHFVSQIQDFTQRVADEMAIREREHYLRTLLNNVVDAIITLDNQGIVETFNRAAEHIFGYSPAAIIGQPFNTLMPPVRDSDAPTKPAIELLAELSELTGNTREHIGLKCSGEVFVMEVAVSEIHHQGGRRLIAVIRDISERKRIEQMKTEFVSTVSHELRTPLTAIAGSLGLINGGALGEVPQTMQSMLQIAADNSARLGMLINDLLDMEKLVAGKMSFNFQSQALQPLIEKSIALNQPYAQQYKVQLVQVEQCANDWVSIDAQRLLQVLANLLSNAAKFSHPDSIVEVHVTQAEQSVRVAVRDHGSGIPLAFQSRIFSKFSQADSTSTRQKGGTGLGLAISKELIEQMNGRIGFESVEEQGSTFWFTLPLQERSV